MCVCVCACWVLRDVAAAHCAQDLGGSHFLRHIAHPLTHARVCRLKMANRMPACVVDVGTGYTKMGFAGNTEPQYIFPSGEHTALCECERMRECERREGERGRERERAAQGTPCL